MPRKVALLAALACSLAFAAPASAAVTPNTDAAGVAGAIADPLPPAPTAPVGTARRAATPPAIGIGARRSRGFATSGATYGAAELG